MISEFIFIDAGVGNLARHADSQQLPTLIMQQGPPSWLASGLRDHDARGSEVCPSHWRLFGREVTRYRALAVQTAWRRIIPSLQPGEIGGHEFNTQRFFYILEGILGRFHHLRS